MTNIERYYQALCQDIQLKQRADEDGGMLESIFTRYAMDLLNKVGETENPTVAYDERGKSNTRIKINGYAISDNAETLDLFISEYQNRSDTYTKLAKEDVTKMANMVTRFYKKAVGSSYVNEIEESSDIFSLVAVLSKDEKFRESLVRINIFILTNQEYTGVIPKTSDIKVQDEIYKIYYRVVDINYLYAISASNQAPIVVNFKELNLSIPYIQYDGCDIYNVYLALMPGECLANLYEEYGLRLMEQNVRTFLQFTSKVNSGIKKTLEEEPSMFLAYNNGLATTASHIEIENGKITLLNDFQIVNGGQTTASLYYARKKNKKLDLSKVLVQMKIVVVNDTEDYSDVVANISRYSNSQNKVSDTDFSSNDPSLIAIEKLSRYIMTPIRDNLQSYWFFERARGQYKNSRIKEGFTKAKETQFDLKYPKNQMFTKIDMAKYINAYNEVYVDGELVIGPHKVVSGGDKNYGTFKKINMPKESEIDNIYYEDLIAKTILFKTADDLYGTKRKGNQIGDLKKTVVPYTIGLLNLITNNKLDLYKIWMNQSISGELSDFLYDLMVQVNRFFKEKSPLSRIEEWAKKEECWKLAKDSNWAYNISEIQKDLIDEHHPITRIRLTKEQRDEADYQYQCNRIKSIPADYWEKIAEWGQESESLFLVQQNFAKEIAHKIKDNLKLTDVDIEKANKILEVVYQNNIDLLYDSELEDDNDVDDSVQTPTRKIHYEYNELKMFLTMDVLTQMRDYDFKYNILQDWQFGVLDDIVKGLKPMPSGKQLYGIMRNYEELHNKGFNVK